MFKCQLHQATIIDPTIFPPPKKKNIFLDTNLWCFFLENPIGFFAKTCQKTPLSKIPNSSKKKVILIAWRGIHTHTWSHKCAKLWKFLCQINPNGMIFFNVFPNIFQVPVGQRIDLQPPKFQTRPKCEVRNLGENLNTQKSHTYFEWKWRKQSNLEKIFIQIW